MRSDWEVKLKSAVGRFKYDRSVKKKMSLNFVFLGTYPVIHSNRFQIYQRLSLRLNDGLVINKIYLKFRKSGSRAAALKFQSPISLPVSSE